MAYRDNQYYLQNMGNLHPHVLCTAWPGISWETSIAHPAFVQGRGRAKLLSNFFCAISILLRHGNISHLAHLRMYF